VRAVGQSSPQCLIFTQTLRQCTISLLIMAELTTGSRWSRHLETVSAWRWYRV